MIAKKPRNTALADTVEATVVQANVEEFAFVGKDDLFYYYDYSNNVGKLAKAGDGDNSIDGASGVQFAKDTGRVYYLLLDQNTGNGKMLLIKDSYANCMIPMLTPYFSKIVVIDPRYLTDSLDSIIKENDFSHMMYLYNANTLFEDNSLVSCLES